MQPPLTPAERAALRRHAGEGIDRPFGTGDVDPHDVVSVRRRTSAGRDAEDGDYPAGHGTTAALRVAEAMQGVR